MTNAQSIIDALLSGYVQQYALSDDAQSVVDRVRQRLGSSPDARKDIEMLYGAKDCEDMALGLLWVAERAGQDPDRLDPTADEEQVVHTGVTLTLTRMGLLADAWDQAEPDAAPAEPEPPVLSVPEDTESASFESVSEGGAEEMATPAAEEIPISEAVSEPEEEPTGVPDETSAQASSAPVPSGEGTSDPGEIGRLLEQLLEALQAGEETRAEFLASLRASFALCLSQEQEDASFRAYCEAVDDFLGYVQDHDMLDDVRVMNFFTNVQEPYAQWMEAAEGERGGILEQAIDFLSDFRAMFE